MAGGRADLDFELCPECRDEFEKPKQEGAWLRQGIRDSIEKPGSLGGALLRGPQDHEGAGRRTARGRG